MLSRAQSQWIVLPFRAQGNYSTIYSIPSPGKDPPPPIPSADFWPVSSKINRGRVAWLLNLLFPRFFLLLLLLFFYVDPIFTWDRNIFLTDIHPRTRNGREYKIIFLALFIIRGYYTLNYSIKHNASINNFFYADFIYIRCFFNNFLSITI